MQNSTPYLSLLILFGIIALIASIPWFFKKYPPPPNKEGKVGNELFKDYKNYHKGFIGNLVYYGMIAMVLATAIIRLINALSGR